jgi:hypothetical protein
MSDAYDSYDDDEDMSSYCVEQPKLRLESPRLTISFSHNGRIVGRLWVNDDSKLEFEGDVEESAEEFFNYLVQFYNGRNVS